jgi:hypothetical protein
VKLLAPLTQNDPSIKDLKGIQNQTVAIFVLHSRGDEKISEMLQSLFDKYWPYIFSHLIG